jgi:hypothetical protein
VIACYDMLENVEAALEKGGDVVGRSRRTGLIPLTAGCMALLGAGVAACGDGLGTQTSSTFELGAQKAPAGGRVTVRYDDSFNGGDFLYLLERRDGDWTPTYELHVGFNGHEPRVVPVPIPTRPLPQAVG